MSPTPKKIKKIHVIINPASGRIEPILPIINLVFKDTDIDWDVFVTKKSGDARLFAQDSVKKKVDAIAVYGGDGSVMEVINGMEGSQIPLAIFPGGTGNVLVTELNIPKDLKLACELLRDDHDLKTIDVGTFNKRYFILRLGLGFEAEMVKGADREVKNKFGRLAYVLAWAKALKKVQEVKYHLKIDGKEYEETGITCIIANSGNLGFSNLSLGDDIKLNDGLLDVLVVRRVNMDLFAYILAVLVRKKHSAHVEVVQHWQGKDIELSSTPKQVILCDGEILPKGPIHASILPAGVRIIVPKSEAP